MGCDDYIVQARCVKSGYCFKYQVELLERELIFPLLSLHKKSICPSYLFFIMRLG